MSKRSWSGRSIGGVWLLAPTGWFLRRCGPRMIRLAAPMCAPLALALLPGLRPVLDAWWRRARPSWPADRRQAAALRHLAAFARMCADRMCAYTHPQYVSIATTKPEARRIALAVSRGCVLLSAHVGAWELGGRLLARLGDHQIYAVMLTAEDPRVRVLVDAAMGDKPPHFIDPRQGPGAALAVAAALKTGGTVCFLGDRVLPGQDAFAVPLCGGPIAVPTGPFFMATAAEVPVLPCFLLERSPGRWRMMIGSPLPMTWHPGMSRPDRRPAAAAMAHAWARQLEAVALRHPHQWWNFHDLWSAAAKARRA